MVLRNPALSISLVFGWVVLALSDMAVAQSDVSARRLVPNLAGASPTPTIASDVFADPFGDGQVLQVGPPAFESCVGCSDGSFWASPQPWSVSDCAPRDVYVFAGVQGFKGATDLGRNGNFGFHEGVNLGGLFGDPWGFAYQAGAQAVHSDFKGNQAQTTASGEPQFDDTNRNQIFVTGAIFRRELDGGLQGGTAIDYFHDSYFESTDLVQLRTEWSLVWPTAFEIGFWGAFGMSRDQIQARLNPQTPLSHVLAPKDMYSAFYRRYFTGGGQGRIWLGLSGLSDVLVGADLSIPLGTSWTLENNFGYVLPKHGTSSGGQMEESFAVSIQLVWYPGRSAYDMHQTPSFPLFNVADNSVFLVDHR